MTPSPSTPIRRLNAALEGRYRVERELGAGGMATVYLADDLKHERKVALKVLKPELAAVVGGERFLAEIKTTANLQHPHILPLYDSGEADGFLFFVMPYVSGETLRERIDREKQLGIEESVRIVTRLAGALDHAHGQGVVHRDIKPGNVLLSPDGEPLLADFGIALAVAQAGGGRVTETGLSLGTPHYMSPEQATGDREVDPRTDVYALGCVLYEMVTGSPPYSGGTAQAVLGQIITKDPDPVTEHRKTVPVQVEASIQKALEKVPADRFDRAGEFAAALANPAFRHRRRTAHASAPDDTRRWKMGFAVAGIVALAATGVAAWALLRAPQPAPESRYVLDLPSGHRLARPVSMTRLDPLPDGRGFVYVGADSTGVERLWVRSRDRLGATTLPGTVGAGNPSVSPDGTRVAFNSSGEAQLLVASLGGGSPVLVEDSLVDYGGISWGDDGYIYYDGHLEGDGLARVPEGGGTPEPVTMSGFEAGELWHFQPSALPGGRGVLFVIRRPTSHDVAVVDLETGEHEVLVSGAVAPRFSSSGHLLYATEEGTLMAAPFDPVGLTVTGVARPVADGVQIFGLGRAEVGVDDTGRLMYVEGRGAGFFELVWVSRDGTVEAVDPQQDPGDYSEPALSPDGDRLAFTVDGQDGLQIWIREIPSGPTTRFTFEGQSWMPTWSADGSHLAFVSVRPEGRGSANRPGNQAVYRRRADGSAPAELLHDPGGAQINTLGYSPDGRWLLFDANADLYALSLDEDGRPGEGEPLLVSGDDRAGELAGQVSPDGRWVAFRSDQGGQNAVYVCPFPSSCEVRHLVTGSDGGSYPRWSRSGEELFYRSYRGVERPIMSVEILPGPTFRWGGVSELFSASDLRAGGSRGIYDVTDDGQRFVFPRRAGAGEVERVVIVENVLRGF